MKVIQLPRSKVHLGAPLLWNVRDEHGKLLLSKGHVIETSHQLDELLERGAFVDVEEVKASAQDALPPEAKKISMPPNLFGLWEQTSEDLRLLLHKPDEHSDFVPQVKAFAKRIVDLLDYNVDIALYRAVRQDNAHHYYYGYSHSIHTAVLCILLARRMQWTTERMLSLVQAALTMNVTILELQGQMAAQDVPMRDLQKTEILAHPAKAVAILTRLGVCDPDWLNAIAQHHEHLDGTGYPTACTVISEMAVALHVTDVFMAKISPRALREALSPQEAIRQLYKEDKGGAISTAIIKEFGIYPPGDFVKLASGELAVVVQRTANAKAPIVGAITDSQGRATTKTVRHDSSQTEFSIVGNATDRTMLKRLPPERLFGFSMAPVK